jgi:hypothetical protein
MVSPKKMLLMANGVFDPHPLLRSAIKKLGGGAALDIFLNFCSPRYFIVSLDVEKGVSPLLLS